MKKIIDVKNDMIEKLKRENGEMSVIINADQYRTVRVMEVK